MLRELYGRCTITISSEWNRWHYSGFEPIIAFARLRQIANSTSHPLNIVQIKRHPPDPFSDGCKDRIRQRRGKWGHTGLSYSFDHASAIGQDMHLDWRH